VTAKRRWESTKPAAGAQATGPAAGETARPPGPARREAPPSVVVGRLLPGSTVAGPLVDYAGNAGGPVRARTAMPMDGATVNRAVATGQGAVLMFENGDPRLPIVTGLIWNGQDATPFQQLLIGTNGEAAAEKKRPVEARLDGQRVVLEGTREVVLKCGAASITLRHDGKIVLKGAYVETSSRGMNRIRGASVKIN